MDPTLHRYIEFAGRESRWSFNLPSTAFVVYSPSHELIHIDEMFVCIATNNEAEYDGVVGLLVAALQFDIRHLDFFLDSELLVSQLNNCYQVHDPFLFRNFMCTRHLVRHFESISFMHVPRSLNSVPDQMSNDVLELHINHCI